MRASCWLVSMLATLAFAAPDYAPKSDDAGAVNKYFQLLAAQVVDTKASDAVPACDLSKAQMPSSPPLPPPTGLILKHVAVGRGTQNYSCNINNATAPPVALGAVANLYNASCVAAMNPTLLRTIPGFALQFDQSSEIQSVLAPANLELTGKHEFLNLTTPYFNLDISPLQLGEVALRKNASAPAPPGAPVGQSGKGNGAVAWLQLLANNGAATGGLRQVYRLNTAGGLQPTTCANMPATFQIEYAAEYWFFESP